MVKLNYFFIISLLALTSCQNLRKRSDVTPSKPAVPMVTPQKELPKEQLKEAPKETLKETPKESSLGLDIQTAQPQTPTPLVVQPQTTSPVMVVPQTSANRLAPRFAVILSGGGVRTFGHVAVLKELQKLKIPIHAVAGVEWGAVVAASLANSGSSSEVEWELSKFKDLDDWQDFIKTAFDKKSTFNFKIPFVCPSLNLKTKTSYLLNRGLLSDLLPYCLSAPGVIKPYGSSVAYFNDLAGLVQHLKATGLVKIILVNVLAGTSDKAFTKSQESLENQAWSQYSATLGKKSAFIDETIDIDLSDYPIDDFDRRREVMVKAAELSYTQIQKLAQKYKF